MASEHSDGDGQVPTAALQSWPRGLEASLADDVSVRVAAERARARLVGEARPVLVGRYRLLEIVGSGAMGQIWRARDDRLARDVAVKLLHPGLRNPQATARLAHEARALARLSHPNVVEVFDVGEVDDPGLGRTVFLAMAFVDGQTLRRWARGPGRTWRARIDALLDAGEGLAAAHRIGLVHRDFKPDNVLVTTAGRVLVADFGLARIKRPSDEPGADDPLHPGPPAYEVVETLAGSLTASGVVVGTPIYMAPEQLVGAPATFVTDVYAWCASAWEVLGDCLPFSGRLPDVLEQKRAARLATPRERDLPPDGILEALRRGMSPRPEARWPSMDALLSHLRRGRARRRGLAAGVAVLAAVTGLGGALASSTPARHCGDEFIDAATWQDRRAAASAVIGEIEDPRLAATVLAGLDEQAAAITHAVDQACAAASPPLACLREAWRELDATALRIARGDLGFEQIIKLQRQLRATDLCRVVTIDAALPWYRRAAVETMRARLLAARIERDADDAKLALASIDEVFADLRDTSDPWPPLLARATYERAITLRAINDNAGAQSSLRSAYFIASEAQDDQTTFLAAVELVFQTNLHASPQETSEWLRHADAAAARAVVSPRQLARRHVAATLAATSVGDLDAADRALRAGEAICSASDCGIADAGLPTVRANLACVRGLPSCLDASRETLRVYARDYGDSSRAATNAAVELVQALGGSGHHAGALDLADELTARLERRGMTRSISAMRLGVFRARSLHESGRCGEARDVALAAAAIAPPRSYEGLIAEETRTAALSCLGDHAAAIAAATSALEYAHEIGRSEAAMLLFRRALAYHGLQRSELAAIDLIGARAGLTGAPTPPAGVLAGMAALAADIAQARGDVEAAAKERLERDKLIALECAGSPGSVNADYRVRCTHSNE